MHLAYYRELSLFAAGVLAAECRWCLNDIEINERKTKLALRRFRKRLGTERGRNWLTLKPFRGRMAGGITRLASSHAHVCTPPPRSNVGSRVISGSSVPGVHARDAKKTQRKKLGELPMRARVAMSLLGGFCNESSHVFS
ncbi:hypothetical protein ALC60_14342 [Trachymyrmex zeteki]|uniref:Uncharacterized protein n=1 Tax=Mycetomoellerius zeteki TaxID=64791 RepID=A0A151WFJ6_9HYME|nr:hypothetical protein ALC60_14342 [Trachymyrmex zeteki]